ncbi:hypothetical protein PI126_g7081 [Phytophthora idaei]|nr:hypothetical protein PI126_g7081 [Phytophthora idaei]
MEMIASLTQKVEGLSARVSCPEETGHHQQAPNKETLAAPAAPPQARSSTASTRRNSGAKSLSSVWIFLPSGYVVTGTDDGAKARILKTGQEAESNILEFLRSEHGKAKSYGTVLKILKRMHATGKLDSNITRYLRLKDNGAVADDSPSKTVHELRIIKQKETMNSMTDQNA